MSNKAKERGLLLIYGPKLPAAGVPFLAPVVRGMLTKVPEALKICHKIWETDKPYKKDEQLGADGSLSLGNEAKDREEILRISVWKDHRYEWDFTSNTFIPIQEKQELIAMGHKPTLKAMREYLDNHFRYYTMNSWNKVTNYARNVKLYTLNIPKEDQDTAYSLLSVEDTEIWEIIRYMMCQFASIYEYKYQMGFNGRSNGYIVLYQGGKNKDNKPCIYPSKSQSLTHEGLSSDSLRQLYDVVKHFDATVDNIIAVFKDYASSHIVEEREIMIPTKVRVVVEKKHE